MIEQLPQPLQVFIWMGGLWLYTEFWMWLGAKVGFPFAAYVNEVGN
ncbi:hypothetical protein [Haloarcula sp. CGMCC 1.6347]